MNTKLSSNSTETIMSRQSTLSLEALKHLKKERKAYYVILVIVFIIGTSHERAIISTTSTFYIMFVAIFTANKFLRDHPNIAVNSVIDLIRLNYVNYIFLLISLLNWWDDIFLSHAHANFLLILYGIFVFEVMLLTSFVFFHLSRSNANLNFLRPGKNIFNDQKSMLIAFGGMLGISVGQAAFVLIIVEEFPEYLTLSLILAVLLISYLYYFFIVRNQYFAILINETTIENEIHNNNDLPIELTDRKSKELGSTSMVIIIIIVILLLDSVLIAIYLFQGQIIQSFIFSVLFFGGLILLILTTLDYKKIKDSPEWLN